MRNQLRTLQSGFTIIELLVVVVVIGILASITIVSYNGITTRANTTSAQAAARTTALKLEAYNAEVGRYPYAYTELTSDSTKSYYMGPTAITIDPLAAAPSAPNTIRYIKCGSGSPANQAAINSTAGNITGVRLHYWTYTNTANANSYILAGVDSGTGILCPAS